jgi:hypothetical protein
VVLGVSDEKGGDELNAFFWTDPWLDGIPSSERFGRLFDLAENKLSTVAEMSSKGLEARGKAWVWRRQLWVWEQKIDVGGVSDFTSLVAA